MAFDECVNIFRHEKNIIMGFKVPSISMIPYKYSVLNWLEVMEIVKKAPGVTGFALTPVCRAFGIRCKCFGKLT